MKRPSPLTMLCILLVPALGALPACERRTALEGAEGPGQTSTDEATEPTAARAAAGRRPPAGASCTGRSDCPSDQICVDHRCRFRQTSVTAEVLAVTARARAEAGDWEGAVQTYEQAFEAYASGNAPVPPETACAAASLMLRGATDVESRERGARHADLCFRSSVPGDPLRQEVSRALGRLRFEGLSLAAFDQTDPASRFFTEEPSRPTVDAVEVAIEMPDPERPMRSFTAARERLESDEGRRAIAECFIQDWELRHEREAEAAVMLRYSTRLVDMGSYDVYRPEVQVEGTAGGDEGFEPCLASSLGQLFEPDQRGGAVRGEVWSQAVRLFARVQ